MLSRSVQPEIKRSWSFVFVLSYVPRGVALPEGNEEISVPIFTSGIAFAVNVIFYS